MDPQTEIHLQDAGVSLNVPSSILHKDILRMRVGESTSLTGLAKHLGDLYLDGHIPHDSYDVGLTYCIDETHDTFSVIRPDSAVVRGVLRKRKLQKVASQYSVLSSQLEDLIPHVAEICRDNQEQRGSNERLITSYKAFLTRNIQNREEDLKGIRLIIRHETFNRLLQGLNDKMFSMVEAKDRGILKGAGLHYLTTMLREQRKRADDDVEFIVDCALNKLHSCELEAATALLPLFDEMRHDPSGRHIIQHPIPTIYEGIDNIQHSTLSAAHKTTLIEGIGELQASGGGDLFLLDAGSGTVRRLEEEIQALTANLQSL